jgi:RimK family alpha-L-glutamate ligase
MTASPRAARIAIFTDEPGWHGRVLSEAFAAAGYAARYVSLKECRIAIDGGTPSVVIPGFEDGLPAGALVRGVAGGTLEEVVLRLDVLHALPLLGVPVVNSGRAIERTVDKAMTSFLLARAGIPTPRTWVTESSEAAAAIAAQAFTEGRTLVLKPLFGSQGEGIARVASAAELAAAVPPTGVWYLQEFIERGAGAYRDWRVLVVQGRARAAMQRVSEHWITNRAQGARCEPATLDPELARLAEAAAAAVDIDYTGVDLMRDRDGRWWVGEVNGIPAWQGLQRVTDVDIAPLLAGALLARIDAAR